MKVSIIMQSYLGEYPGSRSNSDKKFIRAVNSFLNQTYKNSELIIVSDGCDITHKIYYEMFKKEDRIKYIYVDKDTPNMYEGSEKYYRGLPREVGRSISNGTIISYMDSDDFLLENHIDIISKYWKANKSAKMIFNQSWIDNKSGISIVEDKFKTNRSNLSVNDLIFFKIPELGDELWFKHDLKTVVLAPWLFSHINNIEIKWQDVVGVGFSEDMYFAKQIIDKYGKQCLTIKEATYVRCHFADKWDV